MNKCIFSGNLTAKPESKTTTKGTMLTSFTLAVNDGYGDNKKTFFINFIAFGKTGEVIHKYLDKGQKVAVISKVNISQYTDRDGKKRTSTNFIVEEIELPPRGAKSAVDSHGMGEVYEEEIPF